VPKKRGPKTDVLEALLKRVDGLEKRLHTEGKSDDLSETDPSMTPDANDSNPSDSSPSQRLPLELAANQVHATSHANQLMSPIEPRCAHPRPLTTQGDLANSSRTQASNLSPELLLDTYFARIHGKPYYILDEATTRQRMQANQLPGHLIYAVYAVSARYVASISPSGTQLTPYSQICTPVRRIQCSRAPRSGICTPCPTGARY
jgi:hypothetical protein